MDEIEEYSENANTQTTFTRHISTPSHVSQASTRKELKAKILDSTKSLRRKLPTWLSKRELVDIPELKKISFLVTGQCTVIFENNSQESFVVLFPFEEKMLALFIEGGNSMKESKLYLIDERGPEVLDVLYSVRVDKEKKAPYWISYYGKEKKLKYGIGEPRNALALIDFDLGKLSAKLDCFPDVSEVLLSLSLIERAIKPDPVTVEPPLKILSRSLLTIDAMASNGFCYPATLTEPCEKLYSIVSGRSFILDSSDFPDFTQAIERSIKSKNGWCYKKIIEKAASHDPENPNTKETYLRITLGSSQGSSPGIPYVVEIWPPGHYSPIHAHGQAHAVIRVLYGEIQVELYSMLSPEHTTPFKTTTFEQGDVTWISPELNQTHKLTNLVKHGSTCITIQCYMYGEEDREHYPYFDYLHQDEINQFDPSSDADYLEFKQIIKKEWESGKRPGCFRGSGSSGGCCTS